MFHGSLQLFDSLFECPDLWSQFVVNSFHLLLVLFRFFQLLLQLLELLLFCLIISIEQILCQFFIRFLLFSDQNIFFLDGLLKLSNLTFKALELLFFLLQGVITFK
jgi:hypothetical protein